MERVGASLLARGFAAAVALGLLLAFAWLPTAGVLAGNPAGTYQEMLQAQEEAHRLAQELVGLDLQILEAEANQKQLGAEEAATRRSLQTLQQEITRLQGELASQQHTVDAVVRFLYEDGTVSLLEVLLQSTSFTDFLTRFAYVQAIVRYEVGVLHSVAAERRLLGEKEQALADASRKLEEQARRSAEALAKLRALRAEHGALLSSVEARALALSDQLAALDRAILSGFPALEYLLAHFAELPWADLTPDRVDAGLGGLRAIFSQSSLNGLLARVPDLQGIALELDEGGAAAVTGPPSNIRLAGPLLAEGDGLQWQPDTLSVGGVPAPKQVLAGLLANRPLRISLTPLLGLHMRSVSVRQGELELTFAP